MTWTEEQLHNVDMLIHWVRERETEYNMPGRHQDEGYLEECETKVEYYKDELETFIRSLIEEETEWLRSNK